MEQNKKKIFLGKFSSRNMQRAFEEVTTEEERSTTTFKDMVTKLNEHFKMGSNTTLSNFEFHRLSQWEEESFDSFAIRVKHESRKCSFKCESDTCTVRDTLKRDRIIIGATSDEIRKHALKNQWDLINLIKNGRQLEAAAQGIRQIKNNISTASMSQDVSRIKPGKYSKKRSEQFYEKKKVANKCICCSSKTCNGGNKCPEGQTYNATSVEGKDTTEEHKSVKRESPTNQHGESKVVMKMNACHQRPNLVNRKKRSLPKTNRRK